MYDMPVYFGVKKIRTKKISKEILKLQTISMTWKMKEWMMRWKPR